MKNLLFVLGPSMSGLWGTGFGNHDPVSMSGFPDTGPKDHQVKSGFPDTGRNIEVGGSGFPDNGDKTGYFFLEKFWVKGNYFCRN